MRGTGRRRSASLTTPHHTTHPVRPMTPDQVDSTPRVRAPDFPDHLDWINTGGHALTLESLRGKIVLLDFWTFC